MSYLGHFSKETYEHLFRLLVRDYYYEYVDLFTRRLLAEFEDSNNLNETIKIIARLLENPEDQKVRNIFNSWLDSVDFRLLPKKVKPQNNKLDKSDGDNFISNVRTSNEYELEDVHYFTHVPVPLLLISMLWSITVGVLLDRDIGKYCFGNRLNLNDEYEFSTKILTAFKYYLPQYNRWRNSAIDISLENLKKGNNILLIALDIKHCYYRLPVRWKKIENKFQEVDIEYRSVYKTLNQLLQEIHEQYHSTINQYLHATHPEINEVQGIPIGLPSSKILANYELLGLDNSILDSLRPIFYGRYVDDLLLVIRVPKDESETLDQNFFISKYLIDTGILKNEYEQEGKDGRVSKEYKIIGYQNLVIQTSKLVTHYYDHQSSWAGLKEFKKDLSTHASEFRFLPEDDLDKDISTEAYDIQYKGSVNKLRSIIGVKENSMKLSRHLFEKILRYWLGNERLSKNDIDQLHRFFKGRNIFDYCRSWERVFTLLISINQRNKLDVCIDFYKEFKSTLWKLTFKPNRDNLAPEMITEKVISDGLEYLDIAFANALGLISYGELEKLANESPKNNHLNNPADIVDLAKLIRKAKLIRHQFVAWPLLEYTGTKQSLVKIKFADLRLLISKGISQNLQDKAPRFIHFDEWQLFHVLENLLENKINDSQKWKEIIEKFPGFGLSIDFSENEVPLGIAQVRQIKLPSPDNQLNAKRLCIGIANIQINKKNIEASFHPRKKPNHSMDRESDIFSLINEAKRKPKCDLIVLPEVSIPYAWLPFMVKQARRSNIGMVFGLEHWPVKTGRKKKVYNLVATILPFKTMGNYHNCFISLRNKNHYSPFEEEVLESLNMTKPSENKVYDKFMWRNCCFTVYNCFELTDVKDRGIFRSEIDLLISIAWNKDTNHFSNIIETTTRDVHCYMVHANTSQFGDSRIIAPKKTEDKDIIRVKGGENPVLLKGYLDIEKLRDFQSHSYRQDDIAFKPAPAGFEHEIARDRCKSQEQLDN